MHKLNKNFIRMILRQNRTDQSTSETSLIKIFSFLVAHCNIWSEAAQGTNTESFLFVISQKNLRLILVMVLFVQVCPADNPENSILIYLRLINISSDSAVLFHLHVISAQLSIQIICWLSKKTFLREIDHIIFLS